MSTKDLKEKGTHFLLLTGSTLLMAVGTYFVNYPLSKANGLPASLTS